MYTLSKSIKEFEMILGSDKKTLLECEKKTYLAARRSLVAARSLSKGETLKESDFIALRPLENISSSKINSLIGRKLKESIKEGDFFTKDLFI